MDWKLALGIPGVLITVATAIVTVDSYFLKTAEAEELFSKQAVEMERHRLELELDLKQHELEWLLSIEDRDESEEKKISYLERSIDRIEERLMELE